ncbi:energy-coupling factor ABC transporter ATP-binding protein [Natranaerobius thermophilus]|uniref:ABC transporter ATP-binding protein n=1 Tax=Natranaerobius thermophilus (strain ATCC BAA-1301 / DSM 18059 / JW/NM-WN-LF) TaxID=457570 RepID=B2A197_NATTJ|nr:ATP-binding cassette domain-containing protein [Natranaerobius thermophilus]ACB86035.1 ABC transporter related [Natranaerobius thermophilus JW/NM-WN-LF]
MAFAIEINDLNYTYPDQTPALTGINLKITKQKKTAILGANGSGKTTLIYHINGTIQSQDGELKVLDKTINKENINNIRQAVGLLFDNPDNQLFSTTVYGDIAFGPRNLNLEQNEINKRVEMAIEKVGIENLSERPPYSLSLGQKKRAAIAGILAMKPQILVCDEPFSGLDPSISLQLREILDDLKEQGATLVYSTHDVDLTYAWADEVVIMKEGQVLKSGPVDILREERLMEKSGLPLPMLAELFKHSKYNPHTVQEASRLIT